jgi:hypothetical protein
MSDPIFFVIFKALIGFALPMLLAWRELVAVNRVMAERKSREATAASSTTKNDA